MSWSGYFENTRGIRNICRKKLVEEIFIPMKVENEWKILIVDDVAMKIVSSCFKTEEVLSYNVALIENLEDTRQPVKYLSALYILYPSVQNIGFLQADFVSVAPKYLSANLYFLSTVSDELFKEILKYTPAGFVTSFKETELLFLPYESQVYSLCDESFFSVYFDAFKELDINYCAFIAKKLASFCSSLQTRPRIRYRRNYIKNFIIAEAVQQELRLSSENLPSCSSQDGSKPACELLILDRGFDCVSPIIHEFTLQAMSFDLLDIKDDIYEYSEECRENGPRIHQISLTEAEPLWCTLRHEHIANVSKVIHTLFETDRIVRRYPKISKYNKLPDIGEAVRRHLAFTKAVPHIIYRRMASECMKAYCSGINVLSTLEQNLALGRTADDTSFKDAQMSVLNILCSEDHDVPEKLRILLLYIFFAKGITKQEFDDLVTRSQIPIAEALLITNVLHLDIDTFRPGFCRYIDVVPDKGDETSGYKQSRWKPVIRNIMLNYIDGNLCEEKYPYIDSKEHKPYTSVKRTGYWCRDKKGEHMSRLIVFIAGGITYSEMRSAYEVMSKYKGWEVYIGGDCILTPKKFLNKLAELRSFIYKDM